MGYFGRKSKVKKWADCGLWYCYCSHHGNWIIVIIHFPWLFPDFSYFPWPLFNSLTFPRFPEEWPPCIKNFSSYTGTYPYTILSVNQVIIFQFWSSDKDQLLRHCFRSLTRWRLRNFFHRPKFPLLWVYNFYNTISKYTTNIAYWYLNNNTRKNIHGPILHRFGYTVVYWLKNRQIVPTPVSEIALARCDPYRISWWARYV